MQRALPTSSRDALRGFTLTELLVVIGIIVLLAAVGLPMALRSYKAASRARTAADLQAIAGALHFYKQDFGDYPRVTKPVGVAPDVGWNLGPAILCKALVGPYGDGLTAALTVDPQDPPAASTLSEIKVGHCVSDAGGVIALVDNPGSNYGDLSVWAPFSPHDGADGPGFRLRVVPGQPPQGKVYGPYLQPEKFNVIGCMLHDREGNPILYFPARAGGSSIRATVSGFGGYVDRSQHSLYDARDGLIYFRRPASESDDDNALTAIRVMLGDFTAGNPGLTNGRIDAGETPATEGPFLLWTAGPDGLFGPVRPPAGTWNPTKREIDKCDDITNFTQ